MKYNGELMSKELRLLRVIDKKNHILKTMTVAASEVGVSKATYSRLCAGASPDVETLHKVSKFVGKPMEYFFKKK